jgi:ribosome biogenesis GTPase
MNPRRGEGLVVAAYGQRGQLEIAPGERRPYFVARRGLQVCCGDRVGWEAAAGDEIAITSVGPRHNELARQPPRLSRAEILAANLTHLVVVIAPLPAMDPFLVDRYLCAAALMDCHAAIAWNKCDLAGPPDELQAWKTIGCTVWPVSAVQHDRVRVISDWLGNGTGILVGQSGVGKSSLLNALVPGLTVTVADVSGATDEGRHTTTACVMHRLPGGGWLMDTPGVRDFAPAIPDPRRVASGFAEIARAAGGCRFADCTHLREPGCAVIREVVSGMIDERRYESYRRLMALSGKAAERQ